MLLGALLELGTPPRVVRDAIESLGVDGVRMRVTRVKRGAIEAAYVSFQGPDRSHHERHHSEIQTLLQKSDLAPPVRDRSLAVFEALAVAEAKIHGIDPEHVHFHEVGAIDAIGDIVGVCAALHYLEVDRISASALPLGTGTVQTEHGRLPLPAPATLELLTGIPTYPVDLVWETVTPTGAALLRVLVDSFGPMPALVPGAQGFGAGNEREGELPNVLRAVIGEPDARLESDTVTQLETNLDDMNPEQLPFLIERLLEEGALEAALSPLSMKKGRPGHLLHVLAKPSDRDRIARLILAHSSAIGVRFQDWPRLKLARESRRIDTPFGRIRVKRVRSARGQWVVRPEHDDCAAAALREGVSVEEIYRAVVRIAEDMD